MKRFSSELVYNPDRPITIIDGTEFTHCRDAKRAAGASSRVANTSVGWLQVCFQADTNSVFESGPLKGVRFVFTDSLGPCASCKVVDSKAGPVCYACGVVDE